MIGLALCGWPSLGSDRPATGLMGLCYGAALLAHTYAFVAVFAAGVALRHEELDASGKQMPSEALADVERSHKQEARHQSRTATRVHGSR
ncbi:hypothetical protein [Paraburkholderia hospita]|uniref:hypothetical protein n=1 Tax=Paraburkholderia hospita TaxID=169430 RepID=UPI0002EDF5F4|nr:hypothetical protein [Paraburkholderia hospita]